MLLNWKHCDLNGKLIQESVSLRASRPIFIIFTFDPRWLYLFPSVLLDIYSDSGIEASASASIMVCLTQVYLLRLRSKVAPKSLMCLEVELL